MLRIAVAVIALVSACHHDKGRVIVTDTSIEILGPIRFPGQSLDLDATATKMLDAIASTLVGNPSILLVSVHAYGNGAPPEARKQLADQRSDAIIHYLVAHGVEPQRLESGGVADPPSPDDGPAFEIVKRKP